MVFQSQIPKFLTFLLLWSYECALRLVFLQHLKTLKTLKLNARHIWKCGWCGNHFNNIFCIFVAIMCRPKLGAGCLRSQWDPWERDQPTQHTKYAITRLNYRNATSLGWHMIPTKIQKMLLKWIPPLPRLHMHLIFYIGILSVFKCFKF